MSSGGTVAARAAHRFCLLASSIHVLHTEYTRASIKESAYVKYCIYGIIWDRYYTVRCCTDRGNESHVGLGEGREKTSISLFSPCLLTTE